MRKRIGIEAFLKWAYRDELPKQQCSDDGPTGPREYGSCMGGLIAMAEVGALVDFARENRWGVIPDRYARDNPHPDAIQAAHAMEGLDALELCLPDDWNPISDLGEVGQIERLDSAVAGLGRQAVNAALAALTATDRTGQRSLKGGVRRLVMRYAVLNGELGWEIEPPEALYVCVGKGRPGWFRRETVQGEHGPYEVEVDGFDRKRRMPHPDAYRKQYLSPDPSDGIRERGLHEIYVAALHLLHADLQDRLTHFTLDLPERPARPWEDGMPAKPRLLLGAGMAKPLAAPDLSPVPETSFVAPTGLKVALGRRARKNSPVRRIAVA
jgi:hypothetical protein